MARNLKSAQRQLDLAAEELDKQGHKDLADKVDLCNAKLIKASEEELKVITGVLRKINSEADSRNGDTRNGSEKPNRIAMRRRTEAIRARLRSKLAAKKLERDLLSGLDLNASSQRNDTSLRMFRQKRLKGSFRRERFEDE